MAGRPKKLKRGPHSGLFTKSRQPKRVLQETSIDKTLLSSKNVIEGKRRATAIRDDDISEQENFTFFTEYLKMVKFVKRYACLGCNQFGHCTIKPTQYRGVVLRLRPV